MRPSWILLMIAALALLWGCNRQNKEAQGGAGGGKAGQERRDFPVKTQIVSTRPVDYEITAVGTLIEENLFAVPARAAGTAEDVSFSEGDEVTTGQELCRIDYERFLLAAEQARSDVAEKEALVRKAEAELVNTQRETSAALEIALADYELAQSELRRAQKLSEGKHISPEERELVEAKFRRAAAEYKNAAGAAQSKVALAAAALNQERAALAAIQAALKIALDDLERAVVRAPVSGVIQERKISSGQYLPVGTTAAIMVQTDPVRLKFQVPESKSSVLSENMQMSFRVPAYPEEEFTARVYNVAQTADPKTREVTVWARVPNPENKLRPGYFAEVKIVASSTRSAVVVPLASVLPTEYGMVVYTVQDNTAVRQKVRTGIQVTGDAIEILSGLNPGQELVVEGAGALQDGVPVRVLDRIQGGTAEDGSVQNIAALGDGDARQIAQASPGTSDTISKQTANREAARTTP